VTEREMPLADRQSDRQSARDYFRLWIHEQRERKRLEVEVRLAIATLSSVQTIKRPTQYDLLERMRAAAALLKDALETEEE
jgi:hypothetical protein